MLSNPTIVDGAAFADPLARFPVNLLSEATPSVSSSQQDTSSEEQASTQGSDECSEDAEGNPLLLTHLSACPAPMAAEMEFVHPPIYCEIPPGIEILPNAYGNALFATKSFKAGETIYVGQAILVADKPGKIPMKTSHGKEYMMDVQTHTVKQWDDNMRQLYAFDGFMNHSCDPTSESSFVAKDSVHHVYHQVAIKDIEPGQEITCDYTLFEYDCPDKAIYQCACGSDSCLGTVLGFKYLTDAEKLQRLPKADSAVVDAWLIDNPNLVYFDLRKTIPAGLEVVQTGVSACGRPTFKMLATRDFSAGETIFSNQSQYVDEGKSLAVTIDNVSFFLNPIDHTINRGDGKREFFGFDSFMNHSCEPNSDMVYSTATCYRSVARTNIVAGEEITCDYETFDDGLDGSVFECLCGSVNCRRLIKG